MPEIKEELKVPSKLPLSPVSFSIRTAKNWVTVVGSKHGGDQQRNRSEKENTKTHI